MGYKDFELFPQLQILLHPHHQSIISPLKHRNKIVLALNLLTSISIIVRGTKTSIQISVKFFLSCIGEVQILHIVRQQIIISQF